ncbi:MAG: hypothetical protein ACXACY_25485, partial [Candidatus Hodarchaeales archaeon]
SPTLCIGMIDSLNENIWSWGKRKMSKDKFYCQCVLHKPTKYGIQEMVSWIPSNIATVGNVVRLKEHRSDRKWKEGWKVVLVGKKELKSVVKLDSSDYKNHRKMSDI